MDYLDDDDNSNDNPTVTPEPTPVSPEQPATEETSSTKEDVDPYAGYSAVAGREVQQEDDSKS